MSDDNIDHGVEHPNMNKRLQLLEVYASLGRYILGASFVGVVLALIAQVFR